MTAIVAFALATVAAPARASEAEPITVIGEKLRRTQGVLRRNLLTGKTSCKVTAPSGNTRVDAAVCEIALACANVKRSELKNFRSCLDRGREEFLDRYYAGRDAGVDATS